MKKKPLYMYAAGVCRIWSGVLNSISRRYGWLDLSVPMRVGVYLTHRCNSECVYCIRRQPCDHELSTDQWRAIIDDLKKWLKYFTLYFGGGEPCLRHDLVDIIRYAHQRGIVTDLGTNGTLIDASLAASLRSSGLSNVGISIDGDEAVHDALRGAGTHAKALAAIERLRSGMRVCVKTTIFGKNLHAIPGLIELCRDRGIQISFQGLLPDERSQFLWPHDKKQLEDLFAYILTYKRKKGRVIKDTDAYLKHLLNYCLQGSLFLKKRLCMTAYEMIRIDPQGRVRICGNRPFLGDASQVPVRAIWDSAHARGVRRTRGFCQVPCSFSKGGYVLSAPETLETAWQHLTQ